MTGSGPSALILSYILHGNIPEYDLESPHPDPLLHQKLLQVTDLLEADVNHLTEHFNATRFSYSTQALPVNVLLDTLNWPFGETDGNTSKTSLKWRHEPARAISHVVLGNTSTTGGQWVDNPVKASWDIASLSYAGMLSLPGFSFADYYESLHGQPPSQFLRPTRRDVANYFSVYPAKVDIGEAIYYNQDVQNIQRNGRDFYIASHGITCRHLVLASGIFNKLIPARPLLEPLLQLPALPCSPYPLLIVGSGFSAADVLISAPPSQKLIHIFKWAPKTSPSPLRACHQDAYPEYAGVYRKMKTAALAGRSNRQSQTKLSRTAASSFDLSRDWNTSYEGLPNTAIVDVKVITDYALITLQAGDNEPFQRKISGLAYVVGRQGSLTFLADELQRELFSNLSQSDQVTGQTLRETASHDLEIAKDVFIVGSLTGDSLIRFAHGGCCYAAGRIMSHKNVTSKNQQRQPWICRHDDLQREDITPLMSGLDGHRIGFSPMPDSSREQNPGIVVE